MAVYVTSGTLGFALGPLAIAFVADRFGLAWAPLLIAPGLAAVWLALRRVPAFEPAHRPHDAGRFGFGALRPYAKPLALLYFLVVIRGFVSAALSAFVPVLLTSRGGSITLAAAGITVYSLAGGLGRVLRRRTGRPRGAPARHSALDADAGPVPRGGAERSAQVTLICLAVAGFFMLSTLPVNVSFGQLIAPVSAATVASLLMGFAWGAGALLVPVTGWMADRWGLETTMTALGVVPLLGVAMAWPATARGVTPGFTWMASDSRTRGVLGLPFAHAEARALRNRDRSSDLCDLASRETSGRTRASRFDAVMHGGSS